MYYAQNFKFYIFGKRILVEEVFYEHINEQFTISTIYINNSRYRDFNFTQLSLGDK